MSCILITVEFACTTTPLATLLDVLKDVELICPFECLPKRSTLSTWNDPFDTEVVVTFALCNDSSSKILVLPPTCDTLITPLATELYLLPPVFTFITSIAPGTALPETLALGYTGIFSLVANLL